jgi:NAD(P)-dependent dehydrogenase (short-subunit alcohol dehydrogenase family)/ketosteroid isomerase-like protein
MAQLDGKVALVTGAASGIGEATARALAAAGAKVAVGGLHLDGATAVADSIVAAGGEAVGVAFDTSNEEQVAAGVAAVVEAFGALDILHNNAAITSVDFMMRDSMVHQLDVDLWDQTMAVNVRGYMLCAKYAIPQMMKRGGGVIINTSSGAGMQGEVVRPAYGTSKAAIIGFTRSVATEYGKMGIRCNTVMPGLTMTKNVAANVPAPMLEMMKRHTLLADLARPEDVANTVVFLASDGAAAITGAMIPVDGGFGAHGPSFADEVAMWAAMSGAEGAATADKFRKALEARTRATPGPDDAAALDAVLADDVDWHGGEAGGKDALVAAWGALAGAAATATVGDVIYADALHVVGVLQLTSGDLTIRQANVFHLNGEGKATDVWRIPADAAVADALANGKAVDEHPNVATFRDAEEARARNNLGAEDIAIMEKFLREDVKWISPWGQGPENREQVVAQLHTFNQATGDTMDLGLNEIYADDTHAVSLVRLQADRPDKPGAHMDVNEANVFHLDANGQAFEFWGVAEDQAAINSFWM